ncbi:hypothetical protein LINGRAHAP2_LOCUS34458 [Linum grandiflorum]
MFIRMSMLFLKDEISVKSTRMIMTKSMVTGLVIINFKVEYNLCKLDFFTAILLRQCHPSPHSERVSYHEYNIQKKEKKNWMASIKDKADYMAFDGNSHFQENITNLHAFNQIKQLDYMASDATHIF